MIRYIITTHTHLPGVGLARPGYWGGLRYPSDDAAVQAARDDAGDRPFSIARESRRLRR